MGLIFKVSHPVNILVTSHMIHLQTYWNHLQIDRWEDRWMIERTTAVGYVSPQGMSAFWAWDVNLPIIHPGFFSLGHFYSFTVYAPPALWLLSFLSINTILSMQVYPLWVIKGYFHGCVTSLFVFTMLSKARSLFPKPLWHTNYCCVDVFFPADSVDGSQSSNIIPIMSLRFASSDDICILPLALWL